MVTSVCSRYSSRWMDFYFCEFWCRQTLMCRRTRVWSSIHTDGSNQFAVGYNLKLERVADVSGQCRDGMESSSMRRNSRLIIRLRGSSGGSPTFHFDVLMPSHRTNFHCSPCGHFKGPLLARSFLDGKEQNKICSLKDDTARGNHTIYLWTAWAYIVQIFSCSRWRQGRRLSVTDAIVLTSKLNSARGQPEVVFSWKFALKERGDNDCTVTIVVFSIVAAKVFRKEKKFIKKLETSGIINISFGLAWLLVFSEARRSMRNLRVMVV